MIKHTTKCRPQRLRGDGRGWQELVAERAQWDEFAQAFSAHVAAHLSGIVQHVRCDRRSGRSLS